MTDWITWEEASRLTGIRVPTIEHAVRVGRIQRRPRWGSRPTLDRASVERWAVQYRERRAAIANRKNAKVYYPLRRRENGWLKTSEVAEVLGVSDSTVRRLAAAGVLCAEGDGWLWFSESSVRGYADEQNRWVSHDQAAEMLGCTRHEIARLIRQGYLEVRPSHGVQASILRESVDRYWPAWSAYTQDREAARVAKASRRPATAPPDDAADWIDVDQAAVILGMTPGGVRNRLNAERLPGVRRARWWMRREDIERVAAAEAFTRRTRRG